MTAAEGAVGALVSLVPVSLGGGAALVGSRVARVVKTRVLESTTSVVVKTPEISTDEMMVLNSTMVDTTDVTMLVGGCSVAGGGAVGSVSVGVGGGVVPGTGAVGGAGGSVTVGGVTVGGVTVTTTVTARDKHKHGSQHRHIYIYIHIYPHIHIPGGCVGGVTFGVVTVGVDEDRDGVEDELLGVVTLTLDDRLDTFGVHTFLPPTTEQRLFAGQQKVKFAHATAVLSAHGTACGDLCSGGSAAGRIGSQAWAYIYIYIYTPA